MRSIRRTEMPYKLNLTVYSRSADQEFARSKNGKKDMWSDGNWGDWDNNHPGWDNTYTPPPSWRDSTSTTGNVTAESKERIPSMWSRGVLYGKGQKKDSFLST